MKFKKKPVISEKQKQANKLKQRKRQLILSAAEHLFANDVSQLPTVSAISQFANIGKGTIYLYFKTKEEIFLNLLNQYHTHWLKQLRQLVSAHNRDITVIVAEHNQWFIDTPAHLALASCYTSWFRACVSPEILENQENHLKIEISLTVEKLAQTFAQTDPQLTSELVEQLYAMAIGQWQLQRDTVDRLHHILCGQTIIWQHYLSQAKPDKSNSWKKLFS